MGQPTGGGNMAGAGMTPASSAMPNRIQAMPTASWNTGQGAQYRNAFNWAGNVFDQSAAGLGGAMNGAFRGMEYNPMMVNSKGYEASLIDPNLIGNNKMRPAFMRAPAGYKADQVEGGNYASQTLQNTDLDSYMNPYVNNVIDTSMADIDRARKMQSNMTDAQATSAGAFGGSRQALMQAENNRNFLDQSARTASGLRQAGYQNAQQAAMGDINNQNQASQFNLGMDMQGQMANQAANSQANQFNRQMQMTQAMQNQAAKNNANQFNASNMMNYLFSNQQAQNQANQFNSAQGLQAQGMNQNALSNANAQKLQASQLLGNLSNLGFGMGQGSNNMMAQSGQQMQNMNQQLINSAKQQFQGFQQAPQQSMQTLMAALSGSPIPQSQTNSAQPGLFDMMGMGMAMFSDAGLKDNIQHIGTYPGSRHRMYRWEWNDKAKALGIHSAQVGVLAQEVMLTQPEAVMMDSSGYLKVNYGALN